MATYKAIKGLHIQSVSSDNATLQLGDVWYNSTLGKIRVGKTQAAAWASGGDLNTARNTFSGAGNNPAAVVFGGSVSPKQQTFNKEHTHENGNHSSGIQRAVQGSWQPG